MVEAFKGRTVLVTGAGGSIGSQLCRIIASQDARELRLLSLSEWALYNVERNLRREYAKYRDTIITPILGSACDPVLPRSVMEGVDIVVHAAAHKHVPICEANPHQAITNNIGGTWSMAKAAAAAGVAQFCLVSSDKAVNPKSIMGATKRVAELVLADIARYLPGIPGTEGTRFFTVRFGNVMDSAGSVLPLWREQIEQGGPLTLTDERCERYFMTIAEACDLVCQVIAMNPEHGTFVLDMGKPVKLIDIARQMIGTRSIEIKVIGLRIGEKLTEELHYGGTLTPTDHSKIFRVDETEFRVTLTKLDIELLLAHAQQRREGTVPTLWNFL